MSDLLAPEVLLTRASRQLLEERINDIRRAIALGMADGDDVAIQHRRTQELDRLESMLRRSVMVDQVQEDPTIVEVGDEVQLETDDGEQMTLAIVDGAAALDDWVSPDTPVAQALIGRRPGERTTVHAPGGDYDVVILRRRRLS